MGRVAPQGRCCGQGRDPDRIWGCRDIPSYTFPEAQSLRNTRDKEHFMLDIVMLALGLGFFVAAIGYTYACERL
jgi:hypothetical protein